MEERLYYIKVYLLSVWRGAISLFRRSTWKWMLETKAEESFTWPQIVGLILFDDYRREWYMNQYDSY